MSAIEWTDRTWNPVRGCSRVSEGCRNCYAERMAARYSRRGLPFHGFVRRRGLGGGGSQWTGRVELIPDKLAEPLHWRKPRRVFVNSMSDLFHEALTDEAIDRVFAVMALAQEHTFQILTKRPERMFKWFSETWQASVGEPTGENRRDQVMRETEALLLGPLGEQERFWTEDEGSIGWASGWPLPNVWLGVSVENQETADERVPLLLQTPAAKRFVSYEPALEFVDFWPWLSGHKGFGLDWLIVGGESGPGARPFEIMWARSARQQCLAAGIAFFYKQGGSRQRCEHSSKGGCLACAPEDLRVREFPA